MDERTLKIPNMSCNGCVANIKRIFGGIDGITVSEVSLDTRTARVAFDPARVSLASISQSLTDGGYPIAD